MQQLASWVINICSADKIHHLLLWNWDICYWAYKIQYSFIHSVFCLTTGPKPPPKRFLHIVRTRASSFKWKYPLLFLRSSSSFLCLLPRLLVTSIPPFIFPLITCFRRQFLRKMWPNKLAFHFLISCRKFLCSLTLNNTSHFSFSRIVSTNISPVSCLRTPSSVQ